MAFFGGTRGYARILSMSIPLGLPPQMQRQVMTQMGDDFINACIQLLPFRAQASKRGQPPYSKTGTLVASLDYRVAGNRLIVYMVGYGRALHEGLNRPFIELVAGSIRPRVALHALNAWEDNPQERANFDVFDILGWLVRGLAWLDRTF